MTPIRTMPEPPTCSFSDYAGMVDALRTIKDHLQLSNSVVDRLCNFADGQTDKLLGPSAVRKFGPLTFNAMLWALAVKVEITVDMERVREMQGFWESRFAPNFRPGGTTISKQLVLRAKPLVMRDFARSGGLARANQPASKLASRKGGKMRMRKLSRKQRIELARKAGLASAAKRASLPRAPQPL